MLLMFNFTYDSETSKEEVMAGVDQVMDEISAGITQEMLDRAIVKMRSDLYDNLGGTFGLGRADLLCSFALFDDEPSRINTLEDEFRAITPEIVNKTITDYLRKTNRTILTVNPLLANNENPQS